MSERAIVFHGERIETWPEFSHEMFPRLSSCKYLSIGLRPATDVAALARPRELDTGQVP